MLKFITVLLLAVCLISCSSQRMIKRSGKDLIESTALHSAHIGISIYDVAKSSYAYNYQGEKYFVPASNTKIPTCYAAMKYLGDSLTAFNYMITDTAVFILPAGDPSLLHADYKNQPAVSFLRTMNRKIYVVANGWEEKALGYGWSWDDYKDNYMAERS